MTQKFIKWVKLLNKALFDSYGITTRDFCDERTCQALFNNGLTPSEAADYIGDKYNLYRYTKG